jgi:hypothetical protein
MRSSKCTPAILRFPRSVQELFGRHDQRLEGQSICKNDRSVISLQDKQVPIPWARISSVVAAGQLFAGLERRQLQLAAMDGSDREGPKTPCPQLGTEQVQRYVGGVCLVKPR